jgi:hypothetical protein
LYQGTTLQLGEKIASQAHRAGFVTRARLQPGRMNKKFEKGFSP